MTDGYWPCVGFSIIKLDVTKYTNEYVDFIIRQCKNKDFVKRRCFLAKGENALINVAE